MTATPELSPTPECLNNGDVNQDHDVTAGDAQTAFYIALGIHQPTFSERCSADCNGDGDVTAGDSQIIFFRALGIPGYQCVDPLQKGDTDDGAKEREADATENGSLTITHADQVWLTYAVGEQTLVLVNLDNQATAVDGFMLDVRYDPENLKYLRCETGSLNPGWAMFDCHEREPGLLRIGGFALERTIEPGGQGILATLRFANAVPGHDLPELVTIEARFDDLAGFEVTRQEVRD